MSIRPQIVLLAVVALSFTLTGCASHKKDVRVLQAQVGAITEELVRLDDALQETRSALLEEENKRKTLLNQLDTSTDRISSLKEEEAVLAGMYRTPSGFTLPSVQIQQALTNAGYYRGKLDGKIGPATRSAVEKFQKDNGLTVDGVVGRNTWARLKGYLKPVK